MSSSYAAWYWNHAEWYDQSPSIEFCSSDWDTTWWSNATYGEYAIANNNSTTSLIPETVQFTVAESWNMRCLYWDSQNPVVSANKVIAWWYAWNQTIALASSDAWWSWVDLSTEYYNWDNWTWFPYNNWNTIPFSTEWIHTLYLKASDIAWNTITWNDTYRLDKSAPLIVSPSYSPSGWTNWSVTVSITCSDAVSWCDMYTIAGWTISWNTYSRSFSANTTWTPFITLRDNVWNTRTISYNVTNIDITKPIVSDNYAFDWVWKNLASVNITLNPSDANSWIDYTMWCEWSTCNPSAWNTWITINKSANYNNVIRYQTWDNAWNASLIWTLEIKIDTNPLTVVDDYVYDWVWINLSSVTITLDPVDTWSSWIDYTMWCEWSGCIPSGWNTWIVINKSAPYNDFIRYQTWNNAWSASPIWELELKLDIVKPIASDISWFWKILSWTYFNADNSKDFSLAVSDSWAAPIVSIKWYFEKQNVVATDLNITTTWQFVSSVNGVLSLATQDVSIVDNGVSDPHLWNSREYTFKVTEVKDEAWNLMIVSELPTYNYYVFASNIDSTNSSILWETNFDDEVADWITEKILTVDLKDQFNNKIIPVEQSDWTPERDILLTANFTNTLYKDQYNLSWDSGIQLTEFDENIYSFAWANIVTPISNINNNDGVYNLKFKVFAPTYEALATNWREFALWNFQINNIRVDVSDYTWDEPVNFSWPSLDFQFKPIYYISTSWELTNSWFTEWTTQSWTIDISQNWAINPTIDGLYYVKDWLNKGSFTGSWKITQAPTFWSSDISTLSIWTKFLDTFNISTTYILNTLFTLNDASSRDDIVGVQLYWYIKYTVWWEVITYEVDNLNTTNAQNFESIKIFWITNIDEDKQRDLVLDQNEKDVQNLAWEITKSNLKRDIRKNAINTVKVITPSTWLNPLIDDLSGTTWDESNDDNGWDVLWDILYFGGLLWDNVVLDAVTGLAWRKTIIIRWWNLYIKSNVINNWNSDLLWIIVLEDEDWNWWNLYINNDVAQVDAVIYTDKSIIGFNDFYWEIDWNINSTVIDKQLYIRWSIFSENTIWGSRIPIWDGWPVCPFYTESISWFVCDITEAQKYDLNYLRSWVGVSPNFTPSSWNNYPVIIKYNSRLQSTPPPLFEK